MEGKGRTGQREEWGDGGGEGGQDRGRNGGMEGKGRTGQREEWGDGGEEGGMGGWRGRGRGRTGQREEWGGGGQERERERDSPCPVRVYVLI